MKSGLCIGSVGATFALASAAVAGPDWTENTDAGSIPETAQTVGVIELQTITGQLIGRQSPARGGIDVEDFEDVYLIEIKDVEEFLAETDGSISGGATFPTALYLFDNDGTAILGNVESPNSGGKEDSRGTFLGGSFLGPQSDDGTGAAVPAPGMYFLAIAGPSNPPVNGDGDEIFDFDFFGETSGPDGPAAGGGTPRGEGSEPDIDLGGWEGEGETGSYVIALRGVCGVAQPEAVPGLSGPALASLAGLMGVGGFFFIRRRNG